MGGDIEGPPTPAGPFPGTPTQPHRGVMILVFGILGIVLCFPFGIAAWVMGNGDLRQMDAGRMDPAGRGLTSAGRILGIVSVAITVVVFIAAIAVAIVLPLIAGTTLR